MQKILEVIFRNLDQWIESENSQRRQDGGFALPKCEVKLLGQMSLLANTKVVATLSLVGTVDMDAKLEKMDHAIKRKMIELLKANNLVYDEDSEKIWLPTGSRFETLFKLKTLKVSIVDPESALVSKAVKAKEKNKLLIQEAIASDSFPNLVDRIQANGGDLNFFVE